MAINTSKNCVHLRAMNSKLFGMEAEGWTGVIEEEMLVAAVWTPDSRQIITFTDL